jgi:iron complex transport system substrate-binding protein
MSDSRQTRIAQALPPIVLLGLVAVLAIGVESYASPEGGLQLPTATTGDGDHRIRTGSQAYPRVAVDSDDFVVKIPRAAHRIVSQYWSIDEYVYSVVPPQDVVAVSESAYLKGVSNVDKFVEQFHPAIATDPERVLALDPDLMLVSSSGRAEYTSLARSSGVPVYRMQTTFQTLDQVEETIRLTGYLTGNDKSAEKAAIHFHQEIERARALRPKGATHPRILGLGGRYSYGTETLFNDIVEKLGGVNVGAENGLKGYDSVNFEQIIRWDPEWIFAGAEPGQEKQLLLTLLADPAISLTIAAKKGQIIVLDFRTFLPMSPFTTELVKAMAEVLYSPVPPKEAKHG